jgi:carboxypeptidase Taq
LGSLLCIDISLTIHYSLFTIHSPLVSSTQALYQQYRSTLQRIADVKYAAAVLQWDQETYLPSKGAAARGRQIATLTELAHQQFTDEALGNLLRELSGRGDLEDGQRRNLALSLEDYEKSKKLPASFVRRMSEAVNVAFHEWIQARKSSQFQVFEQPLHALVELKKEEAAYRGYEGHPYNALLNEFEKGSTVAQLDALFTDLRPKLSQLLDEVSQRPQVDDSCLRQPYDTGTQWKLGIELLQRIGFDFEAGRQDLSEHPFTINFCSSDVRLTTRVDEQDLGNMTWSCLHEGGHGLYEQGLPAEEYGLPLGEYCSLSIHESQSRLWENCVGRGLPFWQHNFSLLQSFFPQQLGQVELLPFYKAINKVQPSLIRTEADELTYHFHVMIRYEIEKLLLEGQIAVRDMPAYWNEHYRRYLGIEVPNDRQGCLQDVHWSHGSFGYFSTYSLGSLYAAQLYAAAGQEIASLEEEIATGSNQQLLQWLRQKVHRHGKYYSSEELCVRATGQPLDVAHFINYVKKKYHIVYSS